MAEQGTPGFWPDQAAHFALGAFGPIFGEMIWKQPELGALSMFAVAAGKEIFYDQMVLKENAEGSFGDFASYGLGAAAALIAIHFLKKPRIPKLNPQHVRVVRVTYADGRMVIGRLR